MEPGEGGGTNISIIQQNIFTYQCVKKYILPQVLASLARRAEMVAGSLNSIPGLSCNTVQGAMYAFPRIMLPDKVGSCESNNNLRLRV